MCALYACKRVAPWRDEPGASPAEFAGVICLVVALAVALILPATDWGQLLVCKVTSAISQLGGGAGSECSPGGGDEDEAKAHAPAEPCVLDSQSKTLGGGAAVAFSIEGDGTILVERLSNGQYRVTQKGKVQAGASAGVGGGAQFNWDNHHVGAKASASADANAFLEGGETYVVDSESAKDDLVNYLVRTTAVNTVTGPLLGSGINYITDWATGYKPPAASEYTVEAGVNGNIGAGATGGLDSAEAKASGTAALGSRVNPSAGTITTYYKVNYSASAAADAALQRNGAKAEGNAEGMIAVTANVQTGEIMNVSLTGSADSNGMYAIPGAGDNYDVGRIYTASLDATDPATKRSINNMLRSVGIPAPGSGDPGSPLDAAKTLVQTAMDRGTVTRQTMSKNSSEYGFEFDVELLLEASLSAKYAEENVTFSDGEYLYKGKWYTWEGC